jgi:hypothetical protein
MKTKPKNSQQSNEVVIEIVEIQVGAAFFCVLGNSPLVMNSMSEKARQELLLPAKRKNETEREATLKHDPITEFRASIYRSPDPDGPTRAFMPARAFRKAVADACLDTAGATKAEILRLVTTSELAIPIFGIPELYMAMVRQSDMKRTPDIRTRAIFPQWAAMLELRYVRPKLTERTVTNLLVNAGLLIGIGDDRSQKGGDCGRFSLVGRDQADFARLLETGGREAQDQAIANPVCYDAQSEDLLAWFQDEILRREKKLQPIAPGPKKQKAA